METLHIKQHSLAGWSEYRKEFGFVPDPMILRAGEIFLNGVSSGETLDRKDTQVWRALEENLGGIFDFFDILVTRDTIPLINYEDTFDPQTTDQPIAELLGERARKVKIEHGVYHAVKHGALRSLARCQIRQLSGFADVLGEMDALRYDWRPSLDWPGRDPLIDGGIPAIRGADDSAMHIARFLLGGFIFGGVAQASRTTHYIQPKRARLFLGMTLAPDRGGLSRAEEPAIFEAAKARLDENGAETESTSPLPPVLPYLLRQGNDVKSPMALFDAALKFRESREGKNYRELVAAVRGDGVAARRAENLAAKERSEALKLLAPYGAVEKAEIGSLEVKMSGEAFGVPGVEAKLDLPIKAGLPVGLRLWWNDQAPFGGLRKTLRRMWMEYEAQHSIATRLRDIWVGT